VDAVFALMRVSMMDDAIQQYLFLTAVTTVDNALLPLRRHHTTARHAALATLATQQRIGPAHGHRLRAMVNTSLSRQSLPAARTPAELAAPFEESC
jgi:hypothetical protein